MFALARDADEEHAAQLKRRNEVKTQLEQAKLEVSALRDRLTIMLAAMKADENSG